MNTGRQPAAVTCDGGEQGEGPKKTIAAGLAAVKDGGRLAMTGGAYSENLDVRGRDVRVYIVGVVLLDKRVATGPGGVPEGG